MSEFKGTKGDWKILKNDFYCEIRIEESMISICAINKKAKEHLANAKLISCAPEMLKELQLIFKNYDKGTDTYIRLEQLIKKSTL